MLKINTKRNSVKSTKNITLMCTISFLDWEKGIAPVFLILKNVLFTLFYFFIYLLFALAGPQSLDKFSDTNIICIKLETAPHHQTHCTKIGPVCSLIKSREVAFLDIIGNA